MDYFSGSLSFQRCPINVMLNTGTGDVSSVTCDLMDKESCAFRFRWNGDRYLTMLLRCLDGPVHHEVPRVRRRQRLQPVRMTHICRVRCGGW